MIAFIRGTIYKKGASGAIIETGGIGYEVNASSMTLANLGAAGDAAFVHTYMKVSDDGISLYGFLTEGELQMFNMLIGVSGIGPKNALSILSQLSPESIIAAVLSEDAGTLSRAPGVGKKTAARIILDLKDKFKATDILPPGTTPEQIFKMGDGAVNEAIEALISLGYSQAESTRAVMSVDNEGVNSSQLIRLALKRLATI